jgi:hypothetical protein
MKGRIAVHSTHEAADKIGGIGTVLAGLLPEPVYQAVFERSLLVGVYHFPAEGSVIDDLAVREAKGWTVIFDSEVTEPGLPRGRGADARLIRALAEVAARFGTRLVYGERQIAAGTRAPVLLASPQGVRRESVDAFRRAVRERRGLDLERYDLEYPALTDGLDHTLARLLESGAPHPDVPEAVITDSLGRPFPGGVGWAAGRAVVPQVAALDSFKGLGAVNKYLLELQYHTLAAPALWAATRVLLAAWAPLAIPAGGQYDPQRVTLFAHDWLGVPLWWAAEAAGERLGQSVYLAHEACIFRLLAEGALHDHAGLLRAVCHPEGFDASLYPYLAQAVAGGWDLATMFPGSGGFGGIFHHLLNREAAYFDRVLAVGPLVRDEMTVVLRPERRQPPALCPNGIPARPVTIAEVSGRRWRLAQMAERYCGFEPELIVTAVTRAELSKAPWRNVGLLRRLAERLAARRGPKLVCFWLSAPKPRPLPGQVARWARAYGWPLDHTPGPEGDLRHDEVALWRAIADLNERYLGRAKVFYINQFGWRAGELGALNPENTTFEDLRLGTDVELAMSIYEPFGLAALEPYGAGAIPVLSDACGCARHLDSLGLGQTVVTGAFTRHGRAPRSVDDAARRAIEAEVYDQIIDELLARLGVHPAADPLALRAQRLETAQAALEQLSWAAAAERYLLPALQEPAAV